jgi:hypothetical protein
MNPDSVLAETSDVVVTSDSVVLDRACNWTNLAALALTAAPPHWMLDLGDGC